MTCQPVIDNIVLLGVFKENGLNERLVLIFNLRDALQICATIVGGTDKLGFRHIELLRGL